MAMKVMHSTSAETRNEVLMMQLLRSSGNIVAYLASQEFSDFTFMVMEAAMSQDRIPERSEDRGPQRFV